MNRKGTVHGFTLVELLVVMAILSMMASMLLPALQKARAAALDIACTNNLRQVGFLINRYAEESDGFGPCAGGNKVWGDGYRWNGGSGWASRTALVAMPDAAKPALNSHERSKLFYTKQSGRIFRCPADQRTMTFSAGSTTLSGLPLRSFLANGLILGQRTADDSSWFTGTAPAKPLRAVRRPSASYLIIEQYLPDENSGSYLWDCWGSDAKHKYDWHETSPPKKAPHAEWRRGYLHVDGHVAKLCALTDMNDDPYRP